MVLHKFELHGVLGAPMRLALTKTLISSLWYRWGRSSTYLHNMSIWWEEAQPKNLLFVVFAFLHFLNLICQHLDDENILFLPGATQDCGEILSPGYGDGCYMLLRLFIWLWFVQREGSAPKSQISSSLIRIYWSVFARTVHSTSQFDTTSLSKCVEPTPFFKALPTYKCSVFQL